MTNDLCNDEKARIQCLEEEIEELQEENRKLADMFRKKVDDCAEFGVAFHRIKAACEKMEATYSAIQRQRDTLQAEVEKLQKDAERYRWLRNPSIDPGRVIDKRVRHVGPDGETDSIDWEYRSGEELDAAIDAAMKETK